MTTPDRGERKPNPGSDAAIKAGCTCPVLDNGHGAGLPYGDETCFYIAGDCQIHAAREEVRNG